MDYRFRQGGLMRCCTLTLANFHALPLVTAVAEGAKLPCRYCSTTMVYREGAWEWDKSRAPIHGVAQPPEAELAP